MIALTAVACLAALLFRTPIRSRYWAWQVMEARGIAERAAPLTCLCNAGNGGRWGVAALLSHRDDEIRQYGVVVLQQVESGWSRRQLLRMLGDPSEAVREMAALGLALHGDETVVPVLEQLYADGDSVSASAACLALERLATPRAVTALTVLARSSADTSRRVCAVDALGAIGRADCVTGLLAVLDDHRSCPVGTRAEQFLERFSPWAGERGIVEPATSRPASKAVTQTIAERAAMSLSRITGLSPPFASGLSEEQRAEAARTWRDWLAVPPDAP